MDGRTSMTGFYLFFFFSIPLNNFRRSGGYLSGKFFLRYFLIKNKWEINKELSGEIY
jgi:hypothetical protein